MGYGALQRKRQKYRTRIKRDAGYLLSRNGMGPEFRQTTARNSQRIGFSLHYS